MIKVTQEMLAVIQNNEPQAALEKLIDMIEEGYECYPRACGAEGPDGLICERDPGHQVTRHAALGKGRYVRW